MTTPANPRIDAVAAALWRDSRFAHEPQWADVPKRKRDPWLRDARVAVHALDAYDAAETGAQP